MQEYRFAYFNFKRWIFQTDRATSLKFTVYLMEVLGKTQAEFFLCQSPNIRHCTHPELYKNTTSNIPVISQEKIG